MKRLIFPVVVGLACTTLSAGTVWAGGRHSGNVSTPYGQFSAAEMAQAGGDPTAAMRMREQKQAMLYEQQMYKRQQAYNQQQAKQAEFLKKHPEAAKAFTAPARTTRKAVAKTDKKDKTGTTTTKAETRSAATKADTKSAAARTNKAS